MNLFDEQIWSHYKYCYKTAKKFLKNHDDACDVASESILRLLSIMKSENPPDIDLDKIEYYIFQIVINICKDIKRKEKNVVQLDISKHDIIFVLNQDLFDLNKVIEKYPYSINKLIEMKIKGYTTKECADEFNISESNLKVRWHRIQKQIKSEFE